MRNKNIFNVRRAYPCMSWSPRNLYNLWQRTVGPKSHQVTFQNTAQETLFQQRWRSKAAVRAYHGDYIPEKSFKRWYLPDNIPDVRPRRKVAGDDKADLEEYARRRVREKEDEEEIQKKGMAPVGSLMLTEVERRIDVFIFRCCFAHSIYEARRLVIHGDVLLNGKKHTNANTRLAPGDMVSVNPEAIRFFKPISAYTDDVNGFEQRAEEQAAKSREAKLQDAKSQEAGLQETESQEGTEAETKPVKNVFGKQLTPFKLPPYASPWLFIPAYIEPSFLTCSAIYVRHPTARPGYSEIPTPYDADGTLLRYAWEWYVQRKPRMRSKSQLARMPEDRALAHLQEYHEERKELRNDLWATAGSQSARWLRDPLRSELRL